MKVVLRAQVDPVTVGDIIDRRGMIALGNAAVAFIRKRTGEGESYTGEAFEPYSTRPIYITRGSGTGARLAPKGGRKSRTGRSVYYAGGYAQYKRESTGASVVNLVLSGQLMRSIVVADASGRRVTVHIGSGAVKYGRAVNAKRPFMGIADGEVPSLERVAQAQVDRTIRAAQARERSQDEDNQ